MNGEALVEIVAIASASETSDALVRVLRELPPNFGPSIVVVAPNARTLTEDLQAEIALRVEEATNASKLAGGCVHVCPPRAMLEILPDRTCALHPLETHHQRPLDVLLESVSGAAGPSALGVLLDLAAEDGLTGMTAIRVAYGITVVSVEARAAMTSGTHDVLPVPEIAPFLIATSRRAAIVQTDDELTAIRAAFGEKGLIATFARKIDWRRTRVGPAVGWSPVFRTILRVVAESTFPAALLWGEEVLWFSNQSTSDAIGRQRSGPLGRPYVEVIPEAWDAVKVMAARARSGECVELPATLYPVERFGRKTDIWMSTTWSPIYESDGTCAGVLVVASERTHEVLGARRLQTLNRLTAAPTTPYRGEAITAALALLEGSDDLPFAAAYVLDASRTRAECAGVFGVELGHALAPLELDLADHTVWPLGSCVEGKEPLVVADAIARHGRGLGIELAVLHPLRDEGEDKITGVLIFGTTPRVSFDDRYREFLHLVGDTFSSKVADSMARQREHERLERLAELDRAKTAFMSNVSHEFRTPLTLMLSPLEEMLSAGHQLPPGTADQLTLVRRNAVRLLKLVNTLLEFARIEAGRGDAVFEPSDLATLTADVASVFRSTIERAGIRFRVECEKLPAEVHVDREMWEKIVLNLVSNAFKFTFEGEIEVRLTAEPRGALLTVRDSGVGIPMEEVPRLFERFHRVKHTRGRSHEGSGIGLALVSELVRLHAGTISVESAVDRGSCFSVRVPFGDAHVAPPEPARVPRPDDANTQRAAFGDEAQRWISVDRPPVVSKQTPAIRVVWADDNADIRAYVTSLLEDRFEVIAVPHGRAALDAVRAHTPHVVLTDIMMPELDGLALLRTIRADPALRDTPVVLVSARAGDEARAEGLAAGADDYLVKPFLARELVSRVETQAALAVERRRLAARAAENDREVDATAQAKHDFLATLSHELRTPLAAISLWTSLFRRGHLSPGEQTRALDAILSSAEAQERLINDLLDLSRFQITKTPLAVSNTAVADIIHSAVDIVRPMADAKNIAFEVDVTSDLGHAMLDGARLRQVLWNLLSNAIKFTPSRGTMRLRAAKTHGILEVDVADTGEGIAPDFLPHVFEPFRQADMSDTRRHGGLGIGLALSTQIVQRHGGTLTAESGGIGLGATFRVRIPLVDGAWRALSEAAASEERRPRKLAGTMIVLVDDDANNLDAMEVTLRGAGADVMAFDNPNDALSRMEEAPTDIILVTDLAMPALSGYDLVRRVAASRAERGLSPVLACAVSAHTRDEDRRRAIEAGFDIYLAKPLEPERLVDAVADLQRVST